ncbi:uncharacterized protein [Lepidochelys kempii]|uniref:uncharacterized protein isoform X1 n=1 Tax=Lepidochelys kempii TaxID=8472 RepID=UPI003C7012E4
MMKGALVPSGFILDLLNDNLLQREEAKGFLVNGFPRELKQAKDFERVVGRPPNIVIVLDCSTETMIQRLLLRGQTGHRADDHEACIRQRLETHYSLCEPVISYYQQQNLLRNVGGAPQETSWALTPPLSFSPHSPAEPIAGCPGGPSWVSRIMGTTHQAHGNTIQGLSQWAGPLGPRGEEELGGSWSPPAHSTGGGREWAWAAQKLSGFEQGLGLHSPLPQAQGHPRVSQGVGTNARCSVRPSGRELEPGACRAHGRCGSSPAALLCPADSRRGAGRRHLLKVLLRHRQPRLGHGPAAALPGATPQLALCSNKGSASGPGPTLALRRDVPQRLPHHMGLMSASWWPRADTTCLWGWSRALSQSGPFASPLRGSIVLLELAIPAAKVPQS